jgi:hypothetical protein
MAAAKSQMLLLNVVLVIVGILILIENLKYLERRRSSG